MIERINEVFSITLIKRKDNTPSNENQLYAETSRKEEILNNFELSIKDNNQLEFYIKEKDNFFRKLTLEE